MTINNMINALTKMREKVGGDSEVPVVSMIGENDYIEVNYPVVGDFEDQDGNEFKCALIGDMCGEEFTKKGTPHYEWKPYKDKMVY